MTSSSLSNPRRINHPMRGGIVSISRFTSPRCLLFRPPPPPPQWKPYRPSSSPSILPRNTPLMPSRSLQTDAAAPVVVSEDDSFGKKQVISLTPQLYDYVLSNVREPRILRELREETATMSGSQMQVSPDQAQLLAMLVQILGATRCIEVGVFTGYSSLAVALVLPESGYLVACERSAKCLEIAKKYYERAGVSHKVDVKQALAADTLKSLLDKGEDCSYDFAFLDAEKRKYDEYFEYLFRLVRIGGIIVVDNVLWHGKVANPHETDAKTDSMRRFNQKIFMDKRISISMVPIGDGMTICRKIAEA